MVTPIRAASDTVQSIEGSIAAAGQAPERLREIAQMLGGPGEELSSLARDFFQQKGDLALKRKIVPFLEVEQVEYVPESCLKELVQELKKEQRNPDLVKRLEIVCSKKWTVDGLSSQLHNFFSEAKEKLGEDAAVYKQIGAVLCKLFNEDSEDQAAVAIRTRYYQRIDEVLAALEKSRHEPIALIAMARRLSTTQGALTEEGVTCARELPLLVQHLFQRSSKYCDLERFTKAILAVSAIGRGSSVPRSHRGPCGIIGKIREAFFKRLGCLRGFCIRRGRESLHI